MFYAFLALIMAGIVGVDQWTKWLTLQHFKYEGEVAEESFLGLFRFAFVRNPGGAWSIFEGQTWLFLLALVVFAVVIAFLIKNKWFTKKAELVALASIFGGALGNAIDRIFREEGKVVDMIQFEFWRSFPTFNVADIFITLGCAFLIIYVLFFDKEVSERLDQKDKTE